MEQNTSKQEEEVKDQNVQNDDTIGKFSVLKSQEDLEFEEQYQKIREVSQRMSYIQSKQNLEEKQQEQYQLSSLFSSKLSVQDVNENILEDLQEEEEEENGEQNNDKNKNQTGKKNQQVLYHLQDQIEMLQNIDVALRVSLQENVKKFNRIFQFIQEILVEHCDDVDLIDKFQKILQSLVVFHQQFQQIVHIQACLQHEDSEDKLLFIFNKYIYLNQFRIDIKNKDQLNHAMILFVSENLTGYLNEILQIFKEFKKAASIEKEEETTSLWNDLKIIYSKLYTIFEAIPFAVTLKTNDIFSLNKQHPKWLAIQPYVQVKEFEDEDKLQKDLQKLKERIRLANAMVSKGREQDTSIKQQIVQNMSAVYYFFASKESNRKADIFFSDPKVEQVKQTWNLLEHGFGKQALHFAFPMLKYYKKFYIQRRFLPISVRKQLKELMENSINEIDKVKRFVLENPITDFDKVDEVLHEKNEKDDENERITIRFLLHEAPFKPTQQQIENAKKNLQVVDINEQSQKNIFTSLFMPDQKKIYKQIIIQIHGGGFVAMSSRTHQTYTRKWAKSLKVPIFCIDYRKAPEHPYPSALDDVWQSYNWILSYIDKFFNVLPEKIVLVGDSAGGNLVSCLTALCIKHQIRKPDGLLLIYPALNLNLNNFTPSHILALDDAILSHKLLKICVNAYASKNGEYELNPDKDPFISPIHLSDEILSQFPTTRIMVGTEDPLHDDCYRLLAKLKNVGNDCKMTVYKGLPHGFMNYDVPQGVSQCSECVQDASDYLQQLICLD